MGCTTGTNPAEVAVQNSTKIQISCIAHASYYQKVILSFNKDMSAPIGVFAGNGEGVPMKLENGDTMLTISTGANNVLYANFQYSQSSTQGPFQQATVCAPIVVGTGPIVTFITSEDLNDDDDNDSYLTLIDYTTK